MPHSVDMDDYAEDIDALRRAKAAIAAWQSVVAEITERLTKAVGDHDVGTVAGQPTVKIVRPSASIYVDGDLLRERYPSIYQEVLTSRAQPRPYLRLS